MGLSNCSHCRRVFIKKTLENVCPDCSTIRREDLIKINDWLENNDNPHLKNVESEIGVTQDNFIKYLLEGRIINFGKVYCNCELCGQETRIRNKKFICNECSGSLKKPAAIAIPEKPKKALEDTKLHSKRNK